MVKRTQAICWQWPINCLSVFDHFRGLVLKRLIHFLPMFPYYNPSKHQETAVWFSGDIKREHWPEMGLTQISATHLGLC